jgi:hypothetical protein
MITRENMVEAMARAECKRQGWGQCASICLSHSSTVTCGGGCPEAPRIHGRTMLVALDALLALLDQHGCQIVLKVAY